MLTISQQTLDESQKAQVRTNIGAAKTGEVIYESNSAFVSGNISVPKLLDYSLYMFYMSDSTVMMAIRIQSQSANTIMGSVVQMGWNSSQAIIAAARYEIVGKNLYITQFDRGFNPNITIDQSNYQGNVSHGLVKIVGLY